MNIKVGDKVIVIAGKHKGSEAKVLKTIKKTNRVVLEKINVVKKHLKPSQSNPDGGIIEFEASIHISNVALPSKTKIKPRKTTAKKASKKKVETKQTEPKKPVKKKSATKKTTTKKVATKKSEVKKPAKKKVAVKKTTTKKTTTKKAAPKKSVAKK